MKRLLALTAGLVFIFGVVSLHAGYDKNYKSWEVMEEKNVDGTTYFYIRFRLNIPLVKEYMANQKAYVTRKAKEVGPGHKFYVTYTNNIGYYSDNLGTINKGKTLKSIRVFGDFNGWFQQMGGDKCFELEPSKSNPDTWYTKKLVPFRKYKGPKNRRYKFILDYGTKVNPDGSSTDDFAYVEDPLSGGNKGDDGFGGFNSFFAY